MFVFSNISHYKTLLKYERLYLVHNGNGVYLKLELLMNLTFLRSAALLIYDYSRALNLTQ